MKYLIHLGEDDSIILEGETIEEIRDQAVAAAHGRCIKTSDCWSEKIED